MEIKHLQIKDKIFSYTLIFLTSDDLVITFFNGLEKLFHLDIKMLSYDLATGFIAFSINNKVIKAIVSPGQQYIDVLLHSAVSVVKCKKLNTLQSGEGGAFSSEGSSSDKNFDLVSPLSGRVLQIFVKKGDFVKATTRMFVIESMKMENVIYASRDAVIKNVFIAVGDLVKQNQKLVGFKQAGELYGASQTTDDF